jgi:tellurite resistance protein TehA-like permease
MQRQVAHRAKENSMNAHYFKQEPMNPQWFVPVVEVMALRIISGAFATLMVCGGYAMFMH